MDELECVAAQNIADIVCLTESWVSGEIPDSAVGMYDFVCLRNDRITHGGGVAAFVKNKIPCKRLDGLEFRYSLSESLSF